MNTANQKLIELIKTFQETTDSCLLDQIKEELNKVAQNLAVEDVHKAKKDFLSGSEQNSLDEKREKVLALENQETVAAATGAPSIPIASKNTSEQRYLLLDILGEGGMGIVQRVQDTALAREVALKKVKGFSISNEKHRFFFWRFKREIEIMTRLEHPNIVPVYDVQWGSAADTFFTMKKVEGETLRSLLEKGRKGVFKRNEQQLLSIFFKICDAMAYAHSKGVIHRDLKPDNIMIGKFGEVYVMDWGIAKTLDNKEENAPEYSEDSLEFSLAEVNTETGKLKEFKTEGGCGTSGYMPLEQKKDASQVVPQSDIYALGKILRQCFTGFSPSEELELEIQRNVAVAKGELASKNPLLRESPEDLLPPDIKAITEKATKREWHDRYESVGAMVADIRRYYQLYSISEKEYSTYLNALKYTDSEVVGREEALLEALKKENDFIRINAIAVLSQPCFQKEAFKPLLLDLFQRNNPILMQNLISTLSSFKERIVPELLDLFEQNPKEEILIAILKTLKSIGKNAVDAVSPLLEVYPKSALLVKPQIVATLGEISPKAKEIAPFLLTCFPKETEEVQREIIIALGKLQCGIQPEKIILLFKETLYHKSTGMCYSTLRSLVKMGPNAASLIYEMVQILKEKDTFLKQEVLFVLQSLKFQSFPAIPILCETLKVSNSNLQKNAMKVLGAIGPLALRAIPELRKFLKDTSFDLRVYAAEAIGKIGGKDQEAFATIQEALKNESHYVCWLGTQAVKEMGIKSEELISAVTQVLYDTNEANRISAAEVLSYFKAEPLLSIPILIETITKRKGMLKLSALSALENYEEFSQGAAAQLFELLSDGNEEVQLWSAFVLSRLKIAPTKEFLSVLIKGLEHDKGYFRLKAATALTQELFRELADEAIVSSLLERLEDPFWQVRIKAAQALKKIKPTLLVANTILEEALQKEAVALYAVEALIDLRQNLSAVVEVLGEVYQNLKARTCSRIAKSLEKLREEFPELEPLILLMKARSIGKMDHGRS